MKIIIYKDPPISFSDLDLIQKILKKEDVFISNISSDLLDLYDHKNFLNLKDVNGTKTCVLFDRNILTYIISIINEENIYLKENNNIGPRRVAAAIMSYLQCCNAIIEPNIALYELASSSDSVNANKELKLFRFADNLHPKIYADIALDRKEKVSKSEIQKIKAKVYDKINFEQSLRWWEFNYLLALKLSLIELSTISQEEKMVNFLQWMYDDYFYGAPAALFASFYFCPITQNVGVRKMLKKIRSKDRKKALMGVKNTSWDLTVLTAWHKNIEETHKTNELWLLCTRDKAMRLISNFLYVSDPDEKIYNKTVKSFFVTNWGLKTGQKIVDIYLDHYKNINNEKRQSKKNCPKSYWDSVRDNLENEFLLMK